MSDGGRPTVLLGLVDACEYLSGGSPLRPVDPYESSTPSKPTSHLSTPRRRVGEGDRGRGERGWVGHHQGVARGPLWPLYRDPRDIVDSSPTPWRRSDCRPVVHPSARTALTDPPIAALLSADAPTRGDHWPRREKRPSPTLLLVTLSR